MTSGGHFADRLCAAVERKGNAVVVGLDPRLESLPAFPALHAWRASKMSSGSSPRPVELMYDGGRRKPWTLPRPPPSQERRCLVVDRVVNCIARADCRGTAFSRMSPRASEDTEGFPLNDF